MTATIILGIGLLSGTMPEAGYHAKSDLSDIGAVGGFAESDNGSWTLADLAVEAGALKLVVKKNSCCMKGDECPMIVVLANGSDAPVWLRARDSHLDLAREARDAVGNWRPVEFKRPATCGNSRHRVALDAGRGWVWDVPSTMGDRKAEFRYVLHGLEKPVYSEPYSGQISDSMFNLPIEFGVGAKIDSTGLLITQG